MTIRSQHPYPLHDTCPDVFYRDTLYPLFSCSPDIHFLFTWLPDKLFSLCATCAQGTHGVKIGKIFRQFSTENADTSEQNLKFLKNF